MNKISTYDNFISQIANHTIFVVIHLLWNSLHFWLNKSAKSLILASTSPQNNTGRSEPNYIYLVSDLPVSFCKLSTVNLLTVMWIAENFQISKRHSLVLDRAPHQPALLTE